MTETEFESLLTAYLDGQIEEAEICDLERAIQENPAYRARFQEEVRLQVLLHEAAQTQRKMKKLSPTRIVPFFTWSGSVFYLALSASAACLLLAALLTLMLLDRSQSSESVMGRFLQVGGRVQRTVGMEHPYLWVEEGQSVKEGDRIVCDPDMKTLIELNDGTLVSLEDGSTIVIQRNQTEDVDIFVEQGKAVFEVAEQDPDRHRVVVRTPQAVATVLGTLFAVEVQDSWSRADVYEGLVHFRQIETGRERNVSGGQRAESWSDGTLQVQELSRQADVMGSPRMVVSPSDDLYTQEGEIQASGELYVEGGRRVSYMRFEVPDLPAIHSARLHLTQFWDSGQGTLFFHEGSHSQWTEQDRDAGRLPLPGREIARFSGIVGLGRTVEVDVSDWVTRSGHYSIIVTLDAEGNDDIAFGSKETVFGPRLVLNDNYTLQGAPIQQGDAEAPRITMLAPTDDVCLQDGEPLNRSYLHLEKGRRRFFLRFEIPDKGEVEEARLLLRQAVDTGSGTIRLFEGSHSQWTEEDLTADSAPMPLQEIGVHAGIVGPGDTLDIEVSALVPGPGICTIIATLDTSGNEDIAFASKETTLGPRLMLKWRQ